jgi:hypothetical protein
VAHSGARNLALRRRVAGTLQHRRPDEHGCRREEHMVDLDDVIIDLSTLDGLIDGEPDDDLGTVLSPIRERMEEMGRVLKFYKKHCVELIDFVKGGSGKSKEQVLRHEDALRHQVMGPTQFDSSSETR